MGGGSKKLGANIHYDLDALATLGVAIKGEYYDVQTIESIIDEGLPSYSLEAVAQKRLGRGKDDAELKQLLGRDRKAVSQIKWLESGEAASYAITDATLLLGIEAEQRNDISNLELGRAIERENLLTHALWDMHQKGVRIDIEKAHVVSADMVRRANEHLAEARRLSGLRFNPDSSKSLAGIISEMGLRIPLTDKGNPSVSNEWLKGQTTNDVLRNIYEYRRLNKIRRDFIDGLFIRYNINGRLHPQWFQSKHTTEGSEDGTGGADTGRITGSKPNLTQIPARDKELGPLTRSLVIPEEGQKYCKLDFSSQEPRWITHFAYLAKCTGAAELRNRYIADKTLDMHQWVRDILDSRAGVVLERRPVKDINLGLAYGMGKSLLASKIGKTYEEAQEFFGIYHREVPLIGEITKIASDKAQQDGMIRTWGGRLRRFDKWQSAQYEQKGEFNTREECMDRWGSAIRSRTHKALNSAVQGTAADQMKAAIVAIWEGGDLPLIQVYDELGFSVSSEKEGAYFAEMMEEALPGEVPALVEPSYGDNWGSCK